MGTCRPQTKGCSHTVGGSGVGARCWEDEVSYAPGMKLLPSSRPCRPRCGHRAPLSPRSRKVGRGTGQEQVGAGVSYGGGGGPGGAPGGTRAVGVPGLLSLSQAAFPTPWLSVPGATRMGSRLCCVHPCVPHAPHVVLCLLLLLGLRLDLLPLQPRISPGCHPWVSSRSSPPQLCPQGLGPALGHLCRGDCLPILGERLLLCRRSPARSFSQMETPSARTCSGRTS